MFSPARTLVLWSPRILGMVAALYIGLFALDAIGDGFLAFIVHLAPAVLFLTVVAGSWRYEWAGAGVFVILSAMYADDVFPRWAWIVAISGPLLVVGVPFIWSWRRREELHVGR